MEGGELKLEFSPSAGGETKHNNIFSFRAPVRKNACFESKSTLRPRRLPPHPLPTAARLRIIARAPRPQHPNQRPATAERGRTESRRELATHPTSLAARDADDPALQADPNPSLLRPPPPLPPPTRPEPALPTNLSATAITAWPVEAVARAKRAAPSALTPPLDGKPMRRRPTGPKNSSCTPCFRCWDSVGFWGQLRVLGFGFDQFRFGRFSSSGSFFIRFRFLLGSIIRRFVGSGKTNKNNCSQKMGVRRNYVASFLWKQKPNGKRAKLQGSETQQRRSEANKTTLPTPQPPLSKHTRLSKRCHRHERRHRHIQLQQHASRSRRSPPPLRPLPPPHPAPTPTTATCCASGQHRRSRKHGLKQDHQGTGVGARRP